MIALSNAFQSLDTVESVVSGSLSATGSVTSGNLSGFASLDVFMTGTGATITGSIEVSPDNGTTWFAQIANREDSSAAPATSFSSLSTVHLKCALPACSTGILLARFRLSAIASGTATIYLIPSKVQFRPADPRTSAAPTTSVRISTNASDGAATTHHAISAATTNATSVKASAGQLGLIVLSNVSAAIAYFKLYNKASAPTVGTDTPVMTLAIPPNATISLPVAGYARCSTGIAYAITSGIAVSDTGAIGASDVSVSIFYT